MKRVTFTRASRSARSQHQVLLFGHGLIGSSFLTQLGHHADLAIDDHAYDWNAASQRQTVLSTLFEQCRKADPSDTHDRAQMIDVVWSAGRCGFGSTEDDMQAETACFEEVAGFADRIANALPDHVVCLHAMSSAGGLFEGRSFVSEITPPTPTRPYGFAKLAQEEIVENCSPALRRIVYRPSSVYGYRRGGRIGLVNALISNGLKNATTQISGTLQTLRDYVYVDDIGRHLAATVVQDQRVDGVVHLASGKPSSMMEIIAAVETMLGRKLHLRFDPSPSNARNICFQRTPSSPFSPATPIGNGVYETFAKMRSDLLRLDQTWRLIRDS